MVRFTIWFDSSLLTNCDTILIFRTMPTPTLYHIRNTSHHPQWKISLQSPHVLAIKSLLRTHPLVPSPCLSTMFLFIMLLLFPYPLYWSWMRAQCFSSTLPNLWPLFPLGFTTFLNLTKCFVFFSYTFSIRQSFCICSSFFTFSVAIEIDPK